MDPFEPSNFHPNGRVQEHKKTMKHRNMEGLNPTTSQRFIVYYPKTGVITKMCHKDTTIESRCQEGKRFFNSLVCWFRGLKGCALLWLMAMAFGDGDG